MCDTNRSSSLSSLRTSPLCVYSDSLTIGPLHKHLLQNHRAEYMLKLKSLRRTLVTEANQDIQRSDSSSEKSRQIRAYEQKKIQDFIKESQAKLDQLYAKCEREYLANPISEEEVQEPTGSDNGDYLAGAVGSALQKALAEICTMRPCDPIQYLAMWLKNHAHNIQRQKLESIEALQIKLEREDEKLKASQNFQRQIEMRNIHMEEMRRKEQYYKRQQLSDDAAGEANICVTSGDEEEFDALSDHHSEKNSERSESRGSHASPLYTIQEKNTDLVEN